MKNELLICKYCGGSIVHVKFREWKCECCGRSALISNENDVVKCILRIEQKISRKKSSVYELEMVNECTIVADYKKRATMADKQPMFLEIVSGDESYTVESIENIGKGSITLTVDVDHIKAKVEGKIKAEFKGIDERHRYLEIGSSIIMGSVIVSIEDVPKGSE